MKSKHAKIKTKKNYFDLKNLLKRFASVFWESRGVILIVYLDMGKTITREYNLALLYKVRY